MGDEEELTDGEEGELVVRSRPPTLFAGYVDDEKGAPRPGRDAYRTGDWAVRDQSGVFWVTGRDEDAIPGPGFRVGALEVEAALLGHAAVADVAVVPASAGERRGPKAFVVTAPRAEPGDDLAEVLREHARHAGGIRAVPVDIEFVDSLPRTREYKLDRAQLRERAQARPSEPVEASWPEPARLVVPQPRTLESEPSLSEPEPDVEPVRNGEPEPTPIALHAVPEPAPEPEPEPETSSEPEPDSKREPEGEAEPDEPDSEQRPKPQPITAPSQSSGLAARLAAYGQRPQADDESS